MDVAESLHINLSSSLLNNLEQKQALYSGVCPKIPKAWSAGTEMEKFLSLSHSHTYSITAQWKLPWKLLSSRVFFLWGKFQPDLVAAETSPAPPQAESWSERTTVQVPPTPTQLDHTAGSHSWIIPAWSWSLLCWATFLWEWQQGLLMEHRSHMGQSSRERVREHRRNKEQFLTRKGLAAPFNINPCATYSVLGCFSSPIHQTYQPLFLLEFFSRIILFNYIFNAWPLRRMKRTSSLSLTAFLNEADEDFFLFYGLKIT